MNPLYKEEYDWVSLTIQEQIESIRKHLCTGPCGQSSSVLRVRSRINAALKEAIRYINESIKHEATS